jgi:hypothetical protein
MKVPLILMCVALIVSGACGGKPCGWIVLGLGVIALLMLAAGWPHW